MKSTLAFPTSTYERRKSKNNFGISYSSERDAFHENTDPENQTDLAKGIRRKKALQDSSFLFVPKEVITQRSSVKGFTPFANIITIQRQKDKTFDSELKELRTCRNFINTQLAFNKMNEKLYSLNVKEIAADSYRKVFNTLTTTKYKEKMMPLVKKYPSKSLNNSVAYEELLQTKISKKNQPYSNLRPQNKNEFPVYVYKGPEVLKGRPEVREGASLTTIGHLAYCYGGVSKWLINDIDILDSNKWSWTRCAAKGEIPNEGRLGHTACLYKNSIYIFGGEKQYNQAFKMRECLNDLKCFSLDSKEWKSIKPFGDFVEPRRNHIAAVIGKNLLIHGGISSNGLYLSDLMAYNFVTGKWSECFADNNEHVGMAFHTACLILHKDRQEIQLHKGIEAPITDKTFVIKEEGLYFFGGKNEFGNVNNTLRVLKIGQRPLKWATLETKGQPPAPRFQHILAHYSRLNALIVHGGRNDRANALIGEQGSLDDIVLLYFDTLEWITVTMYGTVRNSRFAHCAGIFGTKLAIFGGMNFSSYMDSTVEIVEFDERIVNELRQSENEPSPGITEGYFQLPSAIDSVFVRKAKLPKESKMQRKNIRSVSYLPIPTKSELQTPLKDPQGESNHNDDESPQKNLLYESIRTAFRKASLPRTIIKARTLAPLKLDYST